MALPVNASELVLSIDADHLTFIAGRLAAAGNHTDDVLRRALNRTGDQAFTIVKREVADQMGIRVGVAAEQMKRRRANYTSLTYSITGKGQHIPLREFDAAQTRKGASAAPWKVRRVFPGTFIVKSMGGHVFHRYGPKVEMTVGNYIGEKRQRVERLWGPAVPREIVRDSTAAAFERVVATVLPQRLEHELGRLFAGD